jgi:hypothetical protein
MFCHFTINETWKKRDETDLNGNIIYPLQNVTSYFEI